MPKFSVSLKARLILVDRGKLLLLEQTKPQGGNYTLVGGSVESDEFAKATLIRESYEEAGVILNERDLHLVHVMHKKGARSHRIIFYFKANYWEGKAKSREQRKFRRANWFDANNLPENLTKTAKQVIEAFKRGDFYSEFNKLPKGSRPPDF